jgi:hypothetical protein
MGTTPLGEVIEADIQGFTAQCHRLGEPPALGTLVTATDGEIQLYGVVFNAMTGSIDPGRRSMALGVGEEAEEAVYRAHPELEQLLRTDFQALVVACRMGGIVRQRLPPRPARIHAFVYTAPADEVRGVTAGLLFLPYLVNASVATRDDALAACLRSAAQAHADPASFLLQAGKELATLLGRDLPRLNVLLRLLKD